MSIGSYREHRLRRTGGQPLRRTGGRPLPRYQRSAAAALPAEVDEHPAEVLGVLLHPVVQRLDLLLVQEPQHPLLQLARALARDDLDERSLLLNRLVDDRPQGPVDVTPAVVDVVQVQLELHGTASGRARPVPPVTLRCSATGS